MRKRCFTLIVLLSLILVCFSACAESSGTYTVTFLSDTGETVSVRECTRGACVSVPEAPEKTTKNFLGWYCEGKDIPFDPTTPVHSDMTLTARYATDYESLTNRIAEKALTANLKVETRYYRSLYAYDTSIGSGVLIAADGDMYFLLTNCHAVEKSGYLRTEYTVTDCYGNRYAATLNSADATYDLAVLFFRRGDKDLATLNIAASNPKTGETVAALGQPGGRQNTLTYGKTATYRTLSSQDREESESLVAFDILVHTAPTDHGSSGGALLNEDLEIVGLDFAVLCDADGTFLYTAAIPAEKIAVYLLAHPFY